MVQRGTPLYENPIDPRLLVNNQQVLYTTGAGFTRGFRSSIKMQRANPRSWLPLTHPTRRAPGRSPQRQCKHNFSNVICGSEAKPRPVIETQLRARKCRLTDDRFLGLCIQTAPTPPQTHAFPTPPLAPTASYVKWAKINTLLTHQKRSGHLIMANQVRRGMHDFSNSENGLVSLQNQHPSLRNLPQLRV